MTDLVIIFNHRYEANIPILESLYANRFNKIWYLMPFYQGSNSQVIPVYGGSFTYQSFLAQAAKFLLRSHADRFLIIGDDLILHPRISQNSLLECFNIQPNDAFIPSIYDLSEGEFGRGTIEARKARFNHPGMFLDKELPDYDEANQLISRHLIIKSGFLKHYVPLKPEFIKPITNNLYCNWKLVKARIWHRREQLKHWIFPKQMCFPFIGGFSDLLVLPKEGFHLFSHYCGVFSSAHVFVEIAIPTAMALCFDSIQTEASTSKSGLDVWFPPDRGYSSMLERQSFIQRISNDADFCISRLFESWPNDLLYIHPIKLSKWVI